MLLAFCSISYFKLYAVCHDMCSYSVVFTECFPFTPFLGYENDEQGSIWLDDDFTIGDGILVAMWMR